MTKIKLVADNTTDLPRQILDKYGITVLPLPVFFGDKEYRDGVDITPDEFYQKLEEFTDFPKTSQVTPLAFKEAFTELAQDADVIISIHLSSLMSGTYNSARIAALEVDDAQIVCIDSESASMGYGYQVLAAAKAIEEGCTLEEVLARINQVKETVRIYLAVPSLEHLQRGGRIARATALVGGLLNIVPILTVEDGVVAPFEKVRGKKRIPKRLMELVEEAMVRFGGNQKINLAILYTTNYDEALELEAQIKAEYGITDITITQVGAIIGTHVGPGVIAVIFHKKIS